jgi:hypothetical protein
MRAYSMDLRRRVIAACDAGRGTTPATQPLGKEAIIFGLARWAAKIAQINRAAIQIDDGPAASFMSAIRGISTDATRHSDTSFQEWTRTSRIFPWGSVPRCRTRAGTLFKAFGGFRLKAEEGI